MRRLLTFAMLVVLALPAASAARTDAPNDGTLSVSDARGTITINGRGAVIGSFARGSVTISDPIDGDGTGPIVTGDDWSKEKNDTTTTWGGTKVRFRIIGGTFRIVVRGRGINLSLVGKGNDDAERRRHRATTEATPSTAASTAPCRTSRLPFFLSATSP